MCAPCGHSPGPVYGRIDQRIPATMPECSVLLEKILYELTLGINVCDFTWFLSLGNMCCTHNRSNCHVCFLKSATAWGLARPFHHIWLRKGLCKSPAAIRMLQVRSGTLEQSISLSSAALCCNELACSHACNEPDQCKCLTAVGPYQLHQSKSNENMMPSLFVTYCKVLA